MLSFPVTCFNFTNTAWNHNSENADVFNTLILYMVQKIDPGERLCQMSTPVWFQKDTEYRYCINFYFVEDLQNPYSSNSSPLISSHTVPKYSH